MKTSFEDQVRDEYVQRLGTGEDEFLESIKGETQEFRDNQRKYLAEKASWMRHRAAISEAVAEQLELLADRVGPPPG